MYIVKVTRPSGFEVSFRVYAEEGNIREALKMAVEDWTFHMPEVVITGITIEEVPDE